MSLPTARRIFFSLIIAASAATPARAQNSFLQAGALPDAYMGHAMLAWNGRLYHIGGIGGTNGVFDGDKVYVAPVLSAGKVGAWTAAASLPAPTFYHAAAVWNGTLYVLGGYNYNNGFVPSFAVYYSKLGSDGMPGAWQRGADLPTSLYLHAAAVWNGTIYITGGWGDSGLTNGVYGGAIQADGSIPSWTPLTPLPTGVYAHTSVQNGTLYVLGGAINDGNQIENNVYFAPILPDKTLGPWQQTTPLPQPLASHTSEVIEGRVWVAGGWNGSVPTAAVESAPILADKTLGAWASAPPLPAAVYQQASAVVNDVLYVSGGTDGSNTRADIWALLPPPPQQQADALPPRTTLSVSGPAFSSSPTFVSAGTSFALAAVDDRVSLGDGAGKIASTWWAEDQAAFAPYSAPFQLHDEGSHAVRYYSVDAAGNTEAAHGFAVALDSTPPVSTVSIGAPQAVLASGMVLVSTRTLVAVSASDPLSAGVASGVAQTLAGVDGAALAPVAAPFALPAADGPHTVTHQAIDNVGNQETAASAAIFVDATVPETKTSESTAPYQAADGPIWGAGLLVRFSADDPAPNGAASGVNRTEFSLDQGAAATGPEVAIDEGVHALAYRSVDNVGNQEAWKQARYRVDATPPITSLTIGSPVLELFGRQFVTAQTPLTLSAQDPVSSGVSSGVRSTVYRIDAGAVQAYAGPFTLPAGDHVLYFHSIDDAGNAEPEQSVSLRVDGFLADAAASLGDLALAGGASITGNARADGAFSASGKASVSGDVTAASISLSGKSTIGGRQLQAPNAVVPVDISWARAYAEAHNNGASVPGFADPLVLDSGAQLTLTTGTYLVHGLTIAGHARLAAAGKVQLFVAGPVSVSGGGALNDAGSADDLWLFSDGSQVQVDGQARAAANLVAPAASVAFSGGGAVAGRLLAGSLSLSGNAARPSGTALPASTRAGPAAVTASKASARSGSNAGDGKDGQRSAAVETARLDSQPPSADRGAAPQAPAPAPASAPAPGGPAAPRTAACSLPPLFISGNAAMAMVTADGHAVRSISRQGVVVPQGALPSARALSVSVESRVDPAELDRRQQAASRRTLTTFGDAVSYGPEGTRFSRPVTLELPYDPSKLPAGVSEDRLAVHYWDPRAGDWIALASTVDRQSRLVRATTDHFSTYQILVLPGAPSSAPAASQALLGEVYAFPNPSGPGQSPKLHIQSAADKVDIRIFDLAGALKHSATLDAPPPVIDHVWDAAGAGSGVYLYVVIAHRAGESPAKATGKLAVIR